MNATEECTNVNAGRMAKCPFPPFFSMHDLRLFFGLVSSLPEVDARDAVDAAVRMSGEPGERCA